MTDHPWRRLNRGIVVVVAALQNGCAATEPADAYRGLENFTVADGLVDTYWGLSAIGNRSIELAASKNHVAQPGQFGGRFHRLQHAGGPISHR